VNILLSVGGGLCAIGLVALAVLTWLWHDDPAEHARRDAEGR